MRPARGLGGRAREDMGRQVSALRVLGIDPGLTRTGYALVERGGRLCDVGVFATAPGHPPELRLAELYDGLGELFSGHRPDAVALERVFFNANVKTAMAVGQAAGVALLAAARAGVGVATYTPTEVTRAVVGVGNATKRQVGAMVAAALGLAAPPEPADAADACALALCHLARSRYAAALARAGGGR